MKKNYFLISLTILISCNINSDKKYKAEDTIINSFKLAAMQYSGMNNTVPADSFPRSVREDGSLWLNASWWWTSGFFPGSLWYIYEYTKDSAFLKMAVARTKAVEKEQWNNGDHDIGFKICCSAGNGLRLTNDSAYIPVIINAANSLISRFNKNVGCIRSWGDIDDTASFEVIIDNMMNLELLFLATRLSGDSSYYQIAVTHADTTLVNHFRPDGSSYHLAVYKPGSGKVLKKQTVQGYSDESAWARGQAWGLYGYTVCYRETGLNRYLEQAKKIAGFILNHPNLPKDKIPYWDFNAPDIPGSLRDASAGAIIASALMELSNFVDEPLADIYKNSAGDIISILSDESYRARLGDNQNFLLKHGVGNIPSESEVDVPLSYADYYYLEAMMRYLKNI